MHGRLLHHGVVVAVHLVPAGNGFPPAEGQLALCNAQQPADILFALGTKGQQLQMRVRLFAGLHALGAPDFQLVADRAHGPLALAGHIGHAEHDRLRREPVDDVQVDQLFHLAVGQRAGKPRLCAVDEAGDHRVGAGCRRDLSPRHWSRGARLFTGGRILLIALQQPGTGPEGQRALGGHLAAQFEVRADLLRVGDAGGQHIQRHPHIVFLRDAQLREHELRHGDGIALLLF